MTISALRWWFRSVLWLLRRRGGGSWRRRLCASTSIHQVFQFFAGFEEWNLFGWDFHTITRLRIAADAGIALAGSEAAKSANLNLVPDAKRSHDAVKNCLDNHFPVLACKLRQPGDFVDQISFCHNVPYQSDLDINCIARWSNFSIAEFLNRLLVFKFVNS